MANSVCLKKVLEPYATFDPSKLTPIIDKNGRWNGAVFILATSIEKVPYKYLETALLKPDGTERPGIKIQIEVTMTGFAIETPSDNKPLISCNYCKLTTHKISNCPKLRRKNSNFKCFTCGEFNKCKPNQCVNRNAINDGKLPEIKPNIIEKPSNMSLLNRSKRPRPDVEPDNDNSSKAMKAVNEAYSAGFIQERNKFKQNLHKQSILNSSIINNASKPFLNNFSNSLLSYNKFNNLNIEGLSSDKLFESSSFSNLMGPSAQNAVTTN